ncbi:MAG TPA: methionine--tRNA ligase [Rudaea sp.]|nr:methionine--tRNA ligase [Rudaea sp.]
MPAPRTILVTHALPYANGPLHIGHLLGYIQSDIWVRARRMAGDTVHFVAADDVHGTPIMLAAEKAGMAPEEFIKGMQVSHEADFRDFGVAHDYYYTTHSPENRELAELVYRRLRDADPSHITTRAVRQFYDPLKQMFLPDRYIKGECPNCGTPDQYGDNCENCGATYAPTDLKNPRSVVSGATPELRDSEHYFFKLGDFTAFLRKWLDGKCTLDEPVAHPSVAAKLKEWLDADGGLRDWDISRDAPYFGFPIPDAPGKFFYVWLDAPIGYLASFKKYCASGLGEKNGLTPDSFDEFMQAGNPAFDSRAEMHHFLGKDIINFHGLFWPAMLEGARLRTPNALHVNGYLTVNGEKMSKSRGTFIQARTYLDARLNPEYLRYYFATMLGPEPTDVDLDLKTFVDVVNSHLVGKYINIASRAGKILSDHFGGKIGRTAFGAPEQRLDWELVDAETREEVKAWYLDGKFSAAVASIIGTADKVNLYLQKAEPWKKVKNDETMHMAHHACSAALEAFRILTILLKPIVPTLAAQAENFLGVSDLRWGDIERPLPEGHEIHQYEHLLARIDPKQIEAMIEASKESMAKTTPSPPNPPLEGEGSKPRSASTPPLPQPSPASGSGSRSGAPAAALAQGSAAASPEPSALSPASSASLALISIDDFARLDLRIGTVLQCEFVDGSDKLLRFELDAGELGKRQIFSGIRAAYQEPATLVGRKVVFIANLAPRKMRFGISEGMILSAGSGGDQLFLLDVDGGAAAGMPVK